MNEKNIRIYSELVSFNIGPAVAPARLLALCSYRQFLGAGAIWQKRGLGMRGGDEDTGG